MLCDRYHGALLGLAVGDALGTTLEFKAPGTFKPITDMIGGGPFGLEPGQWTDDTSLDEARWVAATPPWWTAQGPPKMDPPGGITTTTSLPYSSGCSEKASRISSDDQS